MIYKIALALGCVNGHNEARKYYEINWHFKVINTYLYSSKEEVIIFYPLGRG